MVFKDLTPREAEILERIAQGLDNAQIAAHLGVSEKTVRNHITHIFDKLGVENRPQAIVLARDRGLGQRVGASEATPLHEEVVKKPKPTAALVLVALPIVRLNEQSTMRMLAAYSDVISTFVSAHGGHGLTQETGIKAQFDDARDAARAAVAIQQELTARNAPLQPDARLEFRIGIGDATAAETLAAAAEPSAISIAASVHRELDRNREFRFVAMQEGAAYRIEWLAPTAVGAAGERPGNPTVAVLPFINMSADPEQEYFSDGITEDLITALAKHRSLFVIARNSTFAFKGHSTDVRRVGTDLGVDYLVEGAVRRMGRRIRISAQLIETKGGRQLWAERYDFDIERIFEVQDEITGTIAARVEPEVGTAERLRAEKKLPQALQAWDFFHLGAKQLYKATTENNLQAQQLFRRAIELDPTLPQAHAFLSYAIVLSMVYFDAPPTEERLSEAVHAAKSAVALDPQDGLIRFIYGRALVARRAYGDAFAELELAVELNPSLAVSYCALGDSLAYEGRFEEAIPYFQKAIDLSPYDPQRWAFYSYRALAHLLARQFEPAIEWAQKATRIPNCLYWPFAHRVSALGHLGRKDDLQIAISELLERKPEFSCDFARRRLFYLKNPAHLELYVQGLRRAGIRP